jgi:xanthine dehydrogenase YagS FAD-binding subunit
MTGFAFSHAQSVAQVAAKADLVAEAMLAPPNAATPAASFVKAGGVDLIDLIKERLVSPSELISLRDVAGLAEISLDPEGGLRIGAMATLAGVAANEAVLAKYPALAEAVGHSASLELRNLATIGGNLLQRPRCWYFRTAEARCLRKGGGHCFAILGENRFHAIFDNRICAIVHPSTAATALVALDASLELVDDGGAKRTAKLESFFVGPDRDVQRENDLQANQVLTAILLPPATAKRMAHLRLSQKESFDWPLADVAAVLDLGPDGICRRASIVLGTAAPTPHRARAAEAVLQGQRIDEALAREAGRAAVQGATPLSQNAFKLTLFEVLVRRAVLKAVG